jgi:hypothetical protein
MSFRGVVKISRIGNVELPFSDATWMSIDDGSIPIEDEQSPPHASPFFGVLFFEARPRVLTV